MSALSSPSHAPPADAPPPNAPPPAPGEDPDWVIEADDIAAGYGSTLILDGITTRIPRGQITCIIGGSGCGKSTFLRALIGLLAIRRGRLRVLGADLGSLDEEARADQLARVGLMFQYGALLNSLTVGENLSIPLRAHTSLAPEVIDRAVKLKLGLVHLSHAPEKLPGELSGGMRKRAGLARSLMLDPELLLCDEPSAGLDPLTAADLDALLLELRDQLGITVVVVTHELSSIRTIADRIVMLDKGRIRFDGPMEDALRSEDPMLVSFFGRKSAALTDEGLRLDEALASASAEA